MITLTNVSKYFLTPNGRNYVLRDVSVSIGPKERLGVVGKNGAGKSTLMRLFAGVDIPNSGTIERAGSISWPMGLATGLQVVLTGRENAKFACRIQGVEYDRIESTLAFVHEFSEIGDYFEMPVRTYSSGMRARLNFAIAMAFEFDFYIIDELTSVGDRAFRKKSRDIFKEKKENCGFIKVSHNLPELSRECESGLFLNDGELTYFASIKEAIDVYKKTIDHAERAQSAKRPGKHRDMPKKPVKAKPAKKGKSAKGQQPKLAAADTVMVKPTAARQAAAPSPHKPAPMMPRRPVSSSRTSS